MPPGGPRPQHRTAAQVGTATRGAGLERGLREERRKGAVPGRVGVPGRAPPRPTQPGWAGPSAGTGSESGCPPAGRSARPSGGGAALQRCSGRCGKHGASRGDRERGEVGEKGAPQGTRRSLRSPGDGTPRRAGQVSGAGAARPVPLPSPGARGVTAARPAGLRVRRTRRCEPLGIPELCGCTSRFFGVCGLSRGGIASALFIYFEKRDLLKTVNNSRRTIASFPLLPYRH